MLCKTQEEIPSAVALASGPVLQPKSEASRAVLQVTPEGRTTFWSRNEPFDCPNVVDAARDQVREGVVLDGELVVWVDRL